MSVVLMYHGLYRGNDISRIDAEDLPYAVSVENFTAQLDRLAQRRVGTINDAIDVMPEIVLTFDDGHISNFDIAMPLLQERGMNAYLFVTGDYVGKRAHFCHPHHLAQMAQAGMCIGSHGMTHRFFDDLSASEAECELRHSKQQLSEQCDREVSSISFPGGRYSKHTLELARIAGFDQMFGSVFGTLEQSDVTALQPLNRVAIRRTTTLDEFDKIISAAPVYFQRQRSKQQLKLLVKRMLGNRLYHGLYKSICAR